jgi:hypothetical protein
MQMLVDPDGLALVCVICGALGFGIGWAGGVVEGWQRERAARAKSEGVRPPECEGKDPRGCWNVRCPGSEKE